MTNVHTITSDDNILTTDTCVYIKSNIGPVIATLPLLTNVQNGKIINVVIDPNSIDSKIVTNFGNFILYEQSSLTTATQLHTTDNYLKTGVFIALDSTNWIFMATNLNGWDIQ